MLVSQKWLQMYFKKALPETVDIARAFTFHAFEIEGIEKHGDDSVLDIKVLPDRNCYALSHRGIARELAAILSLEVSEGEIPAVKPVSTSRKLEISVQDTDLCKRYIGRVVEGVTVGESPAWLKEKLTVLGQRSINGIVDLTNFVMLDVGQPMHAFDADKVKGIIVVRKAKEGEKMTTLDGKELTLKDSMLVIADEEGVLALAGVKGGTKAQVTSETKNIILESANFKPTSVRRTSTVVGIRTDASKRYENGITPDLAEEAMNRLSSLIAEMNPSAKIADAVDVYQEPQKQTVIEVQSALINSMLGIDVSEKEIVSILSQLRIVVEKRADTLMLTIPKDRLDLIIAEDVAEEVGRIYGYEKVVSRIPKPLATKPVINKNFYYIQKFRKLLAEKHGFSEVYTPSIVERGIIEIQNPLASDKSAMRVDLSRGVTKALELNVYNAPLLGLDQVRVFEIGKVFNDKGEYTSFALGVKHVKKIKKKEAETIKEVLAALGAELGVKFDEKLVKETPAGAVFETQFDTLIADLPTSADYSDVKFESAGKQVLFKKFSSYPFIVRDIAVFVSGEGKENELRDIIVKESGALLVRIALFDVFSKKLDDGSIKTSYAFRMVYQSDERTLTAEEVDAIMTKIYEQVKSRGWEVR